MSKSSDKNKRLACTQYIKTLKDMSECIRCKSKTNLTFHHRYPKYKEFEIASASRYRMSITRLQREINKCDILCTGCHVLEHEEILELPTWINLSDYEIKTTGSSGSFIRVKIKHKLTNYIFRGEHEYSRRIAHDLAVAKLLALIERN